jgi:hypothetical protein
MGPEAQDFSDCKLTKWIHYFILILFF